MWIAGSDLKFLQTMKWKEVAHQTVNWKFCQTKCLYYALVCLLIKMVVQNPRAGGLYPYPFVFKIKKTWNKRDTLCNIFH